jgi:hypothetical protein
MYKTKGFITGATLLALILIPCSIGLACGANQVQEPASAPPITEPATLPSTTPQLSEETPPKPEITADYTTYTDESKLFSISYPSDWETALSRMPELRSKTKEYINKLKSGIPVEQASTIFFAGRRTATAYDPAVSITVEPMLEGMVALDQMVESEVRGVKQVILDYRELSMVKTTIDGREATIWDYEGTMAGQSKLHFLTMITLVDRTTWVVGCATSTDDFSEWENDFNTIVRSLRISK